MADSNAVFSWVSNTAFAELITEGLSFRGRNRL